MTGDPDNVDCVSDTFDEDEPIKCKVKNDWDDVGAVVNSLKDYIYIYIYSRKYNSALDLT